MNGFGVPQEGVSEGKMEKMTLAKALRYLKRVKSNIAKIDNHIKVSNSVIDGNKREWDVEQQLDMRRKYVSHLLELKMAIQEATRPIMRDILEISEIKGEISLLSCLDTKHGLIQCGYRQEQPVKYEAYLKATQIEHKVGVMQDLIDELQTKIDHHNATTQIQINKPQVSNLTETEKD